MEITKITITPLSDKSGYVISKEHQRPGGWSGEMSDEKIWACNGGFLVHCAWGSGKPIYVYKSIDEAVSVLKQAFGCPVILSSEVKQVRKPKIRG